MKNVIKESWQHKTIYRRLHVLQSNYYVLYSKPVNDPLTKYYRFQHFVILGGIHIKQKEDLACPEITNEMHFPS